MVTSGSLNAVRPSLGQPAADTSSIYLGESPGLTGGQQFCFGVTNGTKRPKRPAQNPLPLK